ncbi:MFS transporter [Streptomyces thinghirensis]|nr:MFS transporter [Streptomyces thinghirensis]
MTALLSDGDLTSWGWRIPFLIAGPMGIIGLYLLGCGWRRRRRSRPNSTRRRPRGRRVPLRDMITGQWRALLLCVGLVLVFNVTDYMLLSYMPSYLTSELKYDETHGLLVVLGSDGPDDGRPAVRRRADRPGRAAAGDRCGLRGLPAPLRPALLLIRRGSLLAVGAGHGRARTAAGLLHRVDAVRAAGAVPGRGCRYG